jgi:hypothetical protein
LRNDCRVQFSYALTGRGWAEAVRYIAELDVANEREGGFGEGGFGQAKWHLKEAIAEADDRVSEVIENGTAPFWEIVREAVEARAEP